MKKVISIVTVLSFLLIIGCSKKTDQKTAAVTNDQKTEEKSPAPSLGTKCAKYRSAVYKDQELKTWLATLNKAEQISVQEEINYKNSAGKDVLLAKVKLSDDSIGYTDAKNLAIKAIVFIQDDVKAFNRNNPTSGVAATIPKGYVGMVTDEKANWLQVTVGDVGGGKKVYDKWVSEGFSEDPELIQDAVMLESAKDIFTGAKQGDIEEAKKQIESISKKGSVVGEVAMKLIASQGQNEQPQGEGAKPDPNAPQPPVKQ